ncbi:NAD(P)H-dependent oxidoreductase [Shewanella gelidii]|uniref:NAD(P)H oxidoreductase n=1 Tax=Shewanella gelidii TaxID=1642821 RepID=A0A917N834_9GAMM|nr:NAD(P)H-dependent oxidoreductase [Shewanella gelidii]MCL1097396.1 NAD(P)H-dependent oxidoreductase [Shewanella gelidii]GGI74846.1 NAD(P)H oxidoreductase [Shewanella gelidii]
MKKILINFAHPAKRRSKINAALRDAIADLDGVTVNDLYSQYPDFHIDVQREQCLCENHDVIVFQHPFYWYSTPAILKEWQDLVLEHGWAYGSAGKALEGKLVFQALTAGGDASTYQPQGFNEFTIAELTSPYRATAKLCNMHWLPPFAVMGVHRELADEKVQANAEDYRRLMMAIRDDRFDVSQAAQSPLLNHQLDNLIRRP